VCPNTRETKWLTSAAPKVNSYYTNAMEGNPSKLKDIEAALNNHLAKDKTARDY
jgi:hypothetical protein